MKFPIETDLERWVSFRVGATLLTLRPRGPWIVCDDGKSMPGSAAIQFAFRVPPPTNRSAWLAPPHLIFSRPWGQRHRNLCWIL